jgi:hypothetical protein
MIGRDGKQIRHRIFSEPLARLRDRALCRRLSLRRRQGQIEHRHHSLDRLVPQERHTDDQPHYLIGR